MSTNKTIGELAREIGVPPWKVRRIADGLNVPLPRAGLYRLIPTAVEVLIREKLRRTGWLSDREGNECS